MSGLKRVLIFNQKNFASRLKLNPRNGTEVCVLFMEELLEYSSHVKVDVKSIESTFKSLDWSVTTYTDSTVAQIRDIILKEVKHHEYHALAVVSHKKAIQYISVFTGTTERARSFSPGNIHSFPWRG